MWQASLAQWHTCVTSAQESLRHKLESRARVLRLELWTTEFWNTVSKIIEKEKSGQWTLFKIPFPLFLCVWVFCLCVCLCATCVAVACGGWRRALSFPEEEAQMGAENGNRRFRRPQVFSATTASLQHHGCSTFSNQAIQAPAGWSPQLDNCSHVLSPEFPPLSSSFLWGFSISTRWEETLHDQETSVVWLWVHVSHCSG